MSLSQTLSKVTSRKVAFGSCVEPHSVSGSTEVFSSQFTGLPGDRSFSAFWQFREQSARQYGSAQDELPAAEVTPSCDFMSLCLDNTIQSDCNNWKRLPKKWPVWKNMYWKFNIPNSYWDHGRNRNIFPKSQNKTAVSRGERIWSCQIVALSHMNTQNVRMRVGMRRPLKNYGCLGNIKCQAKYTAYCSQPSFNSFQLFMSTPKFIFCLSKIKWNHICFILFLRAILSIFKLL